MLNKLDGTWLTGFVIMRQPLVSEHQQAVSTNERCSGIFIAEFRHIAHKQEAGLAERVVREGSVVLPRVSGAFARACRMWCRCC
jgi:hypothetical protein